MPRKPMTVEDMWALPRVGVPVPAPDGSFVIVPVTEFSMDTNEKTVRLWRVPADGGAPRAVTGADVVSEGPAVSPDGRWLAFTRKPGGARGGSGKGAPGTKDAKGSARAGPRFPDVPQLHVIALDGGEAERLTDMPLGVADPRWFPDGRRIAFLAPLFTEALGVDGTAELAKAREDEPVKASVTEDRVYRYWDHWLTEGKVHHVFALDLATRALADLTPSSTRWFPMDDPAGHYRISPDGKEIAFTAVRTEPPHDPIVYGVHLAPVPDDLAAAGAGADRTVLLDPEHPADAMDAAYSPDGKWIVYGIQKEIDFYGDRVRLVLHERAGGRRQVLTEPWDRSAVEWAFAPDSRTVIVQAEDEGRMALFALDVESARRDPEAHPPRRIARDGTLSAPRLAGGRIFANRQSLREPPEVVSLAQDGSDLRRLTSFTAEILSRVDLAEAEEIVFTGAGGRKVQMYVMHPPASAPRAPGSQPPRGGTPGPLPLVHLVHGGPHAAWLDQWQWRWNGQMFAARGYIAAMVNFHGSTGWGQEFTASILGSWGEQPYQDILSATDELVRRGLADPSRLAAAGGSYGGYLVSWIASQTDRFACIVNHAGVCDFQTQFSSDITQGRRRAIGGSPWEGIEAMDRYNPMRHAKGFRSPMLITHGEKDYRVPYNQGLALYNVLKAMKVPARLVCYPDENHWILKPRNSRHWFGEVLAWLDRWIGAGRASGA